MLVELVMALGLGYYSVLPPVEHRADNINPVAFISNGIVRNDLCTQMVGEPPVEDYSYVGCASNETGLMIVPNPCDYPDETYARHLCHELGHTNGWMNHLGGEEYKFPQISPQTSPKK